MAATRALGTALLLTSLLCMAQAPTPPPVNSPLLDHLAGKWVLRGDTMGNATTHDIDAEWALQHHYLRVHEVSREKNDHGQPQYEAVIYLTWNPDAKRYSCLWVDVFGGSAEEELGFAEAQENKIAFIFRDSKGNLDFENDFTYDPKAEAWEWALDNVKQGVHKRFARYKLTRAEPR